MSIYCSRFTLSDDPYSDDAGRCVAYPKNDLSQVDKPDWPAAVVMTAHIPPWCVPGPHYGVTDLDEPDGVAGWLRLSLGSGNDWVDVLIDTQAARGLAADLLDWADHPKLLSGKEEPE